MLMRPPLADRIGLTALLYSPRLRLVRFGITGAIGATVQLGLLRLLEGAGMLGFFANVVGFIAAAQVNFFLSHNFTWNDRRHERRESESLRRRWSNFHVAIAGTALLNMVIFSAALFTHRMPDLVASMLGIGVAAVANFVLGDRLIFRGAGATTTSRESDPEPTWTDG